MMERKYWARMRQMRQQQLYAEVSKHNIILLNIAAP